jgi:uncharacterized protein
MKTATIEVGSGLERTAGARTGEISATARRRMEAVPGEPLFLADWDDVLMLHYAVDPDVLKPFVPFPLETWGGRAYVTLVAFNMRDMRPARGGGWTKWLLRPIASHGFLNVRTYVRHNGEPGIHFLAEHLDNALSVKLGPWPFGLPYRLARLNYAHHWRSGRLDGRVTDPESGATFSYRALVDREPASFKPAARGSLTEWLMERYTAFTARGTMRRLFRVWHPPWRATTALVRIRDDSLLREAYPWYASAELIGADFSPGAKDVWMGRPHRL